LENCDVSLLGEWNNSIINLVKQKIKDIKKYRRLRFPTNPICKKTLNDEKTKAYLKTLHDHYVLTPTDKAQNNISIICKKFYIESLLKEVSPDLNKNSTYLLIHEPSDTILNKHEKDIKTFGFQLPTTQRQLPYLMWTPKMHKHPIKQRFIAISSSCTTKLVSSILTSCLKLVQTAHYYYCNKIKNYTGFNFMWTIQNSQEIFPKLHGKIRNLKTYDFSTLYTSIPHKKLLKELAEIVTKAFHGMRQKFIKITGKSYTATWCTNISTKKGYLSIATL
jgi:uncharacterized protein involved in tolerance to divalent cations